jgi:tRNA threonylcarbamoyladenosine biosynthesis protein TsaB
MLILALDCAGNGCGSAVWNDDTCLAERHEAMERGQDRRLILLVQEVMAVAGVTYADLDRIAVTTGPGSFTGLRIGLAAARGLGFSAQRPVVGFDRFTLYHALIGKTEHPVLVLIESKRAELYARFYPITGNPDEPVMLTRGEIDALRAAHPNLVVTGDVENPTDALRELSCLVSLTANVHLSDLQCQPRPLYIRPPDVTVKA